MFPFVVHVYAVYPTPSDTYIYPKVVSKEKHVLYTYYKIGLLSRYRN